MLLTEESEREAAGGVPEPLPCEPVPRGTLRCDGCGEPCVHGQCNACLHYLCHDCLQRHRFGRDCNPRSIVDDGGCRE